MEHEIINILSTAKYLFRDDKVIILNRTNGQWMKISKECYDILMEYNRKVTYEQFYKDLFDEEDETYMRKVITTLDRMEILGTETSIKLGQVIFAITNRCNLYCRHCAVNADVCKEDDELSTEEVLHAFDKIIEANPRMIVITGGEALLRNDFIELITYLRAHFKGTITLMTNGTLINPSNVEVIINSIDNIDISLDGVDEETVSIIRGKGVFKKVITSIKLLKATGFDKISTSMVLTADNLNRVNEYKALNEKLGCKGVTRILSMDGRAGENSDILTQQQLFDVKGAKGDGLIVSDVFQTCSCCAGVDRITIGSDGDMYPCSSFMEPQYRLGNILQVEFLKDCIPGNKGQFISPCIEKYEPSHCQECQECDISYFCWTCLYEQEESAKAGTLKKRCRDIKPLLEKVWE